MCRKIGGLCAREMNEIDRVWLLLGVFDNIASVSRKDFCILLPLGTK